MELIAMAGTLAGGAGSLGTAMGVASAGLGLAGALSSANAQEKQAKAQAAEIQRQGNEQHVARIRKAQDARREGQLMLSRYDAVAGASGAGSGQMNTIADIIKYTSAEAGTQAGLGQQAANNSAASAANTISAGKHSAMQTRIAGVGNFLGSMGKVMGGSGGLGGRPSTANGGWQTTTTAADPDWMADLWKRFG